MSFEKDLAVGKIAEKEFLDVLLSRGMVAFDVGDFEQYRKLDTDIIAINPFTKIVVDFEIKQQMALNSTGNLLLETVSSQYAGSQGWYYYSKAKWWVFAEPQCRRFHLFEREKLMEYVQMQVDRGKLSERGGGNTNGRYYLVPMQDIIEWFDLWYGSDKGYYKQIHYVHNQNEHEKNSLTLAS